MLSPFMESLNSEENGNIEMGVRLLPGRWENLTKEAFIMILTSANGSADSRITYYKIMSCQLYIML